MVKKNTIVGVPLFIRYGLKLPSDNDHLDNRGYNKEISTRLPPPCMVSVGWLWPLPNVDKQSKILLVTDLEDLEILNNENKPRLMTFLDDISLEIACPS